MHRNSWVFAVLAPIALASCGLLAPEDARLPNLSLAVSDSVIGSPSVILLTGKNNTDEPLLYNACFYSAYRLESGVWSQRAAFPGVRTCPAVAHTLRAGQALSFSVNVPSDVPPGTYRVQLKLTAEDDRETYAVSAPFRIQ